MAVGRVLALALAAAALTVPVGWVRAWIGGHLGRLAPYGGDDALVWAFAGTFAAAVALGLVVAGLRSPSLLSLTRRADRLLGQAQRLSTAYEVHARGAPSTLIEYNLLTEVEARANSLDWPAVGRTPWRREYPISVAVACVLALGALLVPVPAAPTRGAGAITPTAALPDRRAQDAATAQRVADLLQNVAEAEDSPYLQAVATSFAELGERLAAGTIDAAEAERVLEELVGHLEVAARDVGGGFADALQAALAGRESAPNDETAETAAASSQASGGDDAQPVSDAEGGAMDGQAAASSNEADASMYLALEALVDEVEGRMLAPSQRPGVADSSAEDTFYGGVLNAETDPNAAPSEAAGLRAQGPAAGDIAGAADQSSERAGDAAGGGAADLAGVSDAFLQVDADAAEAAALPRNESADGRFVEVELVPDAVLGSARAFDPGGDAGPFRRADEAATVTRTIDATYRDVVSRYFLPGTISTDGSPGGAVP